MFYIYRQNNSGGLFSKPAINLIVEAEDAEEADLVAVEAGVYFDPEYTIDCECCGTRWVRANDEDRHITMEDALNNVYGKDAASEEIPFIVVVKNRRSDEVLPL